MHEENDDLSALKNHRSRSALIRKKLNKILIKSSSKNVVVRKGERTILKIPLTIGIGSATAAILINAPLTAIAAIVAMSNDVNINLQQEEEKTNPDL